MILYSKDKTTFEEVDDETIQNGLTNGTIIVERVKIPKKNKRPYKSSETIYNELKDQGVEVAIKNGVYCKVVFGTFEAINEQTKIDDYDLYIRSE